MALENQKNEEGKEQIKGPDQQLEKGIESPVDLEKQIAELTAKLELAKKQAAEVSQTEVNKLDKKVEELGVANPEATAAVKQEVGNLEDQKQNVIKSGEEQISQTSKKTTEQPKEKIKTPLGLTQESQEILQNKLPELLSAAGSGKLNFKQAEDLGLALALNGDIGKINELIMNESIGQSERNDIAKESLRLFADSGHPAEAEKLLNYLSKQPDYEVKPEDAFNREKMFSNETTRLQRNIAQSYLDSGDIDSAKNVTGKMMKGVDRDAMGDRLLNKYQEVSVPENMKDVWDDKTQQEQKYKSLAGPLERAVREDDLEFATLISNKLEDQYKNMSEQFQNKGTAEISKGEDADLTLRKIDQLRETLIQDLVKNKKLDQAEKILQSIKSPSVDKEKWSRYITAQKAEVVNN